MTDQPLTLTIPERDCLVTLLELALKETRIEEHRTRSPSFREHVVQREELIVSVLGKLGHKPS